MHTGEVPQRSAHVTSRIAALADKMAAGHRSIDTKTLTTLL